MMMCGLPGRRLNRTVNKKVVAVDAEENGNSAGPDRFRPPIVHYT